MRSVVFIVFLLWAAVCCTAKTIYVDVNGPNDPGTGSYEDPFRRIQDAIDFADHNDTIIVAEGVYAPIAASGIDFEGKAVTLCGTDPNDPNVVASTRIDPNGTQAEPRRGFYFHSTEDANSVLNGLTITGGYTDYGGGIYCFSNSSPSITNCIITDNSADYGGGICCLLSNPIITNCIITNNTVTNYGGAIACSNSSPSITNCTITSNSSGLYCNIVGDERSTPVVVNCIFAHNTGFGVHEYAALADPNVSYCCFYNNSGGDWYDFDSSSELNGADVINSLPEARDNIDTDPLVEPDGCHLVCYSPCINTGDPTGDYIGRGDIDGESRLLYGRVDIGVDEVFPIAGDLEPDGDVDTVDVGIMAAHWLQTGPGTIGDIHEDNIVNLLDFALLAANWTSP